MRLLLTGASGQLGGYLLREIVSRELPVVAWSGSRTGRLFGVELQPVDLADPAQTVAAFRQAAPTAVIHAAAIAAITECRRDPARAQRVNTHATAVLADLAEQAGARFLLVSTDLVFDGEKGWYREADAPCPLSMYGRTKAAAETPVVGIQRSLVVRLSLLFGPGIVGRPYFFDEQVAAIREGRPITLFRDEWRTPVSLATGARALVALVQSDVGGILHLGGPERLSRWEMGQRLAAFLGVEPSGIEAGLRSSVPAAEPRPRDTSLDSSRWRELFPKQPWPTWSAALSEMATEPHFPNR
ncbi:MAG TPA: SDR family oxidoreductase [Gemmataceae bacterium]|nr:SDR family oxidoreductase [Gemmataceae bacterium]